MAHSLAKYWETGVWLGIFNAKHLPPGSPI
jgi:hypothetical protein